MNDSERLWTVIALAAVALVVVGLVVAMMMRRRALARHAELERRFGPEYERAVDELGSPARADRELARRAERVQNFHFNDLGAADRSRFVETWNRVQAQFVDNPVVAVTSANELINEVMRARGYPVEHYEQRVADLSVEHPTVVQHYRAAHELSRSVHNGTVDTEQLRQALVHYRMLFADLLEEGTRHAAHSELRRAHA
jgi:hypothetical protein